MNIMTLIRKYLHRRREKNDLLSMDKRMLNDIGISRTDAEYLAGRFKRDKKLEPEYRTPNEKPKD